MAPTEETIQGGGGGLFMRSWRPAGAPRAVVAICPGFNSHSGYFQWAADQLTAAGFAVCAIDLRGRGRSEGERFFVHHVNDYLDDLGRMIALAKSRDPGLPVYLYGHSAGGVVSVTYALDHQAQLAGLICASFAFQVPAPDVALAIIKGLSHIAPHAAILKLKNEDFSRDPAAVKAMNEDPLIANETQPADTVAALVRADERLKAEFPRITLPVFIQHGTMDKATKYQGSQRFHDEAGSADKTLKLYEGHYHDMLADLGKEAVMDDIVGWITARL